MLRRNQGFSINELMVVIGIIAIVATIALPSIFSWLPRYRMSSAARDVLGTFEFARLTAVKRNADAVVDLDYTNEVVRVSVAGTTLRTVRMPSGIDLKEPAAQSLGAQFRYIGQGMPDRSGDVLISNGGRHPDRKVSLSAGGSVKIEKVNS
jgi:type IV fimbrial biogenesis protein FimT